MEVFVEPAAMRAWSFSRRAGGRTVALVPTMGALHDGHRALIAEAQRRAGTVVVSIFVNPLQFDRRDDFDRYPRPTEEDLDACRRAAVDAVYVPTESTMYPPRFDTRVVPGALAERLEGPRRPGHFDGVTTVVAKLFGATIPDMAMFGQKDYQQLAIVRRMVSDLDMGIEIVGVPTIREADGLAGSSRNARLSAADRVAAVVIPEALTIAVEAHAGGERRASVLRGAACAHLASEPRARAEYVEIVDAETLAPLETVEHPAVVLAAVWFGEVRLIDNRLLG
jgi:pantoate--beta-alanine ligase